MTTDQIKSALEAVDACGPGTVEVSPADETLVSRALVAAFNLLRDPAIQARLSGEWPPDREAVLGALNAGMHAWAKDHTRALVDHEADAILALAPTPAPREANPWRLIAEHDGSIAPVDLWAVYKDRPARVTNCRFDQEGHWWNDNQGYRILATVTYFMPLPAPPTEDGEHD